MYNNPTPVAVALVRFVSPRGDVKLLAVKRGIPPIGGVAFPGGYINEGESAEVAVARELLEETGIKTTPAEWYPVATRITEHNRLLIFMKSHVLLTFQPGIPLPFEHDSNGETLGLELVDCEDSLCFPLHQDILSNKILWV